MTLVHIELAGESADGARAPSRGMLQFAPTDRRTAGDVTILPSPFQASLVAGVVDVELATNGPGWAWRIREYIAGIEGREIVVNVPATGPVNYADLVEVDPDTLNPAPTASPAWAAFAVTPDPTHPGFYLIGTN